MKILDSCLRRNDRKLSVQTFYETIKNNFLKCCFYNFIKPYSGFYTIVEVVGENRLGILYEMTQALTDYGSDIHFTRISTLGNRIVDVFYVQGEWGEKIEEKNRIDQLRRTVFYHLTSREYSQP